MAEQLDLAHDGKSQFESMVDRNYSELSNSQKKIAAYIYNHPEDGVYLPMSQLANIIGVSNSAITRFVKKLGFESIFEFRAAISGHFNNELNIRDRLNKRLESVDGEMDFFESLVKAETEYMFKSISEVQTQNILSAGSAIASARCVFMWAPRPSWGLADVAAYRLGRLSKDTTLIFETGHYVLDKGHNMTDKDVLIGLAFQRSPKDLEQLFNLARSKKAKTILITDLGMVPPALNADIILSAPRGPYGVYNSYSVPMLIIHAVLLATSRQLAANGESVLEDLDLLRKSYNKELIELGRG